MSFTSIIILASLLFFLLLPYVTSRRASKSTPSGFAVGARNYGWFSLTAGLSATFIGGATLLNLPSVAYTYGWYALADVVPVTLGLLLSACVVVPVIRQSDALSLGTYLRAAGPLVAAVSGVLSTVVYTLISGAQLLAVTRLLEPYLPVPAVMISLSIGLLAAAYIIYNGYAAVTLTDRVQLIVMVVLFLGVVGGALLISPRLQLPDLAESTRVMPLDMILLLALPLLFVPVSQDVHVRIHSARSTRHAILGCLAAAGVYFAFGCLAIIIGVSAAAAGTALDSPDQVTPVYLIKLLGPVAVLPMVAILAAVLSTFDSVLFAAATSLTYDTVSALKRRETECRAASSAIATVAVLVAASVIALLAPRILSIILSALVIYVAVLLPLLLGVALRVNSRWLAGTALVVLLMTTLNEAIGWAFPFRAFVITGVHALVVLILRQFNHISTVRNSRHGGTTS